MTSIPASRSARAMIFAPRSCPSRPGLAITTLVLDCIRAPLAADGGRGTRRAPGRPAKRRTSAAAPRAGLLELGLELVADAEARLDERVARRDPVDLLAQAADEDVAGAVAVGLAPPPDLLQQPLPGDAAPAPPRAGRSAAPRSRPPRRGAPRRGASRAAPPHRRARRARASRTA